MGRVNPPVTTVKWNISFAHACMFLLSKLSAEAVEVGGMQPPFCTFLLRSLVFVLYFNFLVVSNNIDMA